MGKKKTVCNKKKFTRDEARRLIKEIVTWRNKKNPWRDEVSYYECDVCGSHHLSSVITDYSYAPKIVSDKSYFDTQKEKWGVFLQKHSAKKAVITRKTNKKYGT